MLKCVQIVAGPSYVLCLRGSECDESEESLLTNLSLERRTTHARGIHRAAETNIASTIVVADTLFTRLARLTLWLDRILRLVSLNSIWSGTCYVSTRNRKRSRNTRRLFWAWKSPLL